MTETLDLNSLSEVLNLPFPAQTKQVAGKINGVLTDVLSVGFSDRILITVSQQGRLAHWVRSLRNQADKMKTNHLIQLHVPLENNNPGTDGFHTFSEGDAENSLLPLSSLTATTLLGGHASGQETTNQLLARQIGSAIATKTPNEKRVLLVGLGLNASQIDRDAFFAIVDLVLQCI
jgi:proteasome assembly chaperone 3